MEYHSSLLVTALCVDSVRDLEVVLGNGTLADANATHDPDLFKALKGGAGKLGLLTRFNIAVSSSGDCGVTE